MNIAVSGATGYLASRLIHAFLREGHSVLCLKRAGSDVSRLVDMQDKLAFADVDHSDILQRISDFAPEAVVHTACAYERGGNDFATLLEANFVFPMQLLQYALACDVRLWINTGTALPENFNAYSLLKHQFSEWGKFYAVQDKITFYNVKPEHFYGEGSSQTNFLSRVLKKLRAGEPLDLTAGTQRRDFVYVRDLETIYTALLSADLSGYTDIPVGTGTAPCIREVVEYLKELTRSDSALNFGAIPMRINEPNSNCDLTEMKKLELQCAWTWKEGMKKMVEESKS